MNQRAYSLLQIGRHHRSGCCGVYGLLELDVLSLVDARQAHSLFGHLGDHDVIGALEGSLIGLNFVQIGNLACQCCQFLVACSLKISNDLLHGLSLLLSVLLQLVVGLLQLLDCILQGFVGGTSFVLLFVHFVEGEQSLLVTFANIVKIFLQCTIVFEQLLLFVDALLVVIKQTLLLLSLFGTGLVLRVQRVGQHNGND